MAPTNLQSFGRFVWKLLVYLVVMLAVMALIGFAIDAIFDLPDVEVR